MDFSNITVWVAFVAGLVSFLSPCVFALVPAYVGYLSGRSLAMAGGPQQSNRWVTFTHGLAFVLGFSVVFVILGVAVSGIGGVLFSMRDWLTKIGGVIVVVFGLHMLGIIHIPFLEYDLRPQNSPDRNRGYLSSAMMGVFFSAGWSPCVGPVLGAILTMALNGGSISQGTILLSAYSAGLAIPFLAASLGVDWVTNILRNHGRVMQIATKGMGVFLIIIGVMLFLGTFQYFAQWAPWWDFGI
ncbi:MAG TPA: cytochrome c biogenesis CcdA family protein [Anaerolineales bacterium]|nr:cytochrome c biogenesis CcdA family protein [Anaerolineales bacterium]